MYPSTGSRGVSRGCFIFLLLWASIVGQRYLKRRRKKEKEEDKQKEEGCGIDTSNTHENKDEQAR